MAEETPQQSVPQHHSSHRPEQEQDATKTEETDAVNKLGASGIMGLFSGLFGGSSSSEEKPSKPRVEPLTELPADASPRYLGFCHGDRQKALDLYNQARQLRADHGLDGILDRPYENWEVLSTYYKKCIHGKSKKGEIVMIEAPGKMDLGGLKANGFGRDYIVKHFSYYLEYVFTYLQKEDAGQIVLVVDMTDLGFLKLASPDFIGTISALSNALGSLYPRRLSRYVLVNAPSYFETLWGLVANVLPAGARDNVILCKNAEDFDAIMDRQVAPKNFGGTSDRALGDSDEERALKAHVASRVGGQ